MDRLLTDSEKRELISQFLGELMDEFDLTGKQLAEVAGVSQPTVSSWLNRKITAGLDKVVTIAHHYGKEESPILSALGVTNGQPYQFKILGHLYEALDKDIEAIEDPEDREMAIEQLKDALNSWRHLLERLNHRRTRKEDETT